MTRLEKLYNLADKNNIKVYFFNLKEIGCLGLNIEKEEVGHLIFLDNKLKHNNKLHIEVLSHELGHHFTTQGNYISKPLSYLDKLQELKCESKANRWAYDYLVPKKDLIEAINKNIDNINDLADYFDVRTEFMIKRIEYLSLRTQMLCLDNGKYLILTNLPNLYIYEDVGGFYGN